MPSDLSSALYYFLLFLSVIPPGDGGIVSTFGFTRGREAEAASSGEKKLHSSCCLLISCPDSFCT